MRTIMMTMRAGRFVAGWPAIAIAIAIAGAGARGAVAQGGEELRFNRDVRPILAETCFRCHGPGVKKANLRLDRREAVLKPTESDAIPIVPGKADQSEVIRRIFSEDEGEVMPPPGAKKPLT